MAKAFLCFVCFLCLITQLRECIQCVKPWAVPKPRLTCDAAGAGGKTFPPTPGQSVFHGLAIKGYS